MYGEPHGINSYIPKPKSLLFFFLINGLDFGSLTSGFTSNSSTVGLTSNSVAIIGFGSSFLPCNFAR